MEFIQENSGKIILTGASASFAMFLWEHFARKRDSNFKPSTGITYLSVKSKALFEWLGGVFAHLSSFYTYINLGEFKQTAIDIGRPIGSLVVSPLYSIKGYFDQATEGYKHPYLICLGTMTIVLMGFGLMSYYSGSSSSFDSWPVTKMSDGWSSVKQKFT